MADYNSSYTGAQIDSAVGKALAAPTTPVMDGAAAAGSSTAFARADHVHPTDTSRLAASLKGAANGVAELDENGELPGSQLSEELKQALLGIAEKVAYTDENGQEYYQALYEALYPSSPYLYVLTEEDFSRGTQNQPTSPYYSSNINRISYTKFDIALEGGKTYKFTATVTEDGAMGVQGYSAAALAQVNAGSTITAAIYDPGWQSYTTTLTMPSYVVGARFIFRNASNTAIGSTFAVRQLTIEEVTE